MFVMPKELVILHEKARFFPNMCKHSGVPEHPFCLFEGAMA